jgi:hypothetical protein
MPESAWAMLIIACTIIYGGLAYCIGIAVGAKKKKNGSPD